MSAHFNRHTTQPSSTYGQHGPRSYEASSAGADTVVPQPPQQPPRLPSLSTWANIAPPHSITSPVDYPETVRAETEQRGQRPAIPYSFAQRAYYNQSPEVSTLGPVFQTGPALESTVFEEDRRREMCFRGDSYSKVHHGEDHPRLAARRAAPMSTVSRSHAEQTTRRARADSGSSLSQNAHDAVSTRQREMQSKRQAGSPAPQDPAAKRSREQSPPRVRRPMRVRDPVPNLLGPDKAPLIRNLKFSLRIRQQPAQARSCGFADKDRRSIDPPPIVQLLIEGEGLSQSDLDIYLRHDRYVMCCTLVDDKGVDAMNMEQDGLRSKRMMGESSTVPFVGADEHGEVGCFFAFNDLSCRTPGDYRLCFSVSVVPTPEESRNGIRYPRIGDITSDVFKAYNAKMFPGMTESSPLARALKEQGCNISVRKGNEKTKNPRGRNAAQQDDDDGDDEED